MPEMYFIKTVVFLFYQYNGCIIIFLPLYIVRSIRFINISVKQLQNKMSILFFIVVVPTGRHTRPYAAGTI